MQEKKHLIHIVDDEAQIRKMLNIFLDTAEFKIQESENGKQAIRMAASLKPDLILLDLGLPDMDGKEVITAIREWSNVPIVVLSVRSSDDEVAKALNMGADDYIIKPFNVDVLLARINANLRKAIVKEAGETELHNGDMQMDLLRHEVSVKGEKIAFTPKEYDLLRYFLMNKGKMLTHKQILKEIWGNAHVDDVQYLRVYIGQVRDKLAGHPQLQQLISTEPGIGYRMESIGDSTDSNSAHAA